jgi:hypothetical protein
MKKIFTLLLAFWMVALFASGAIAAKSVVAILKASPEESQRLDGKFHIRDLAAIAHTPEYAASEGDHTRATWDPESEEVWYRYIKQATDLAGGIPVKKGETVLIKPNFVVAYFTMKDQKYGDDTSIQGAFTDPRACLAVARICKEMGAGRIIIGESPARGDAWSTFMCYGLVYNQKRYARMGIPYELTDLDENWEMMPGLGLGLKQYPIPKILKEVDCLVNIGAFKTHAFAGVTIALKNLGIGLPSTRVIGASKYGLPHNYEGHWERGVYDMPISLFLEYKYACVPINNFDETMINRINSFAGSSVESHDFNAGGQSIFLGRRWKF